MPVFRSVEGWSAQLWSGTPAGAFHNASGFGRSHQHGRVSFTPMTANPSAPMPVVVTAASSTTHQRLGYSLADLVITIPCSGSSQVMPEVVPLSWHELLGQR